MTGEPRRSARATWCTRCSEALAYLADASRACSPASTRMTATKIYSYSAGRPISTMMSLMTPMTRTPSAAPTIVPRPPLKGMPPRITPGDRLQRVAGAGQRVDRILPGGDHDSGERRRQAGRRQRENLDAVRPHADRARRVLVRSGRPDPGAERRERHDDLGEDHDDERDDDQDRDAADRPGDPRKAEGARRADGVGADVVAAVEQQGHAAEAPVGGERDEEGGDAAARDERARRERRPRRPPPALSRPRPQMGGR